MEKGLAKKLSKNNIYSMDLNEDINLIYEIGAWRNIRRLWEQHFHDGHMENDVEHSFRVMWIALVLARHEGGADEHKIMKMALVHDLAEIRCGDQSIVQKLYIKADEESAVSDTLSRTSLNDFIKIHEEYKLRQSKEAKIVKDADNLEPDFELQERKETGSKLAEYWIKNQRPAVKEKLYTVSAKKLFDTLNSGEVSAHTWFLRKNKFTEQPHHSE